MQYAMKKEWKTKRTNAQRDKQKRRREREREFDRDEGRRGHQSERDLWETGEQRAERALQMITWRETQQW